MEKKKVSVVEKKEIRVLADATLRLLESQKPKRPITWQYFRTGRKR